MANQQRIPLEELRFSFSRSSGPGGQKVNKTSTRVTLLFDLDASTSMSETEKRRIRRRLKTRISREGVLRVVCSRFRTQSANRRAAVERFGALIEEALWTRRPRVETRVPRSAKERRLREKERQSNVKRTRSKSWSSAD